MLEAQQQVILEHGDSWAHALQADAGALQARRILDRLIDREQQGAVVARSPSMVEPTSERVSA